MKYSQKPSIKFGDFAEKLYLCGTEQYNQRKRNTMDQNDYLEFSEDGKTVIGCRINYDGAVEIPDGVTRIGKKAFLLCMNLKSIEIPNSVTKIGLEAFCDCMRLTSIEIPDSVTEIGRGAFGGCESLTSIAIPDSVTIIGEDAFIWCSSLSSIEIPDSVTEIGESTFEGCTSLVELHLRHKKPIDWTQAFASPDLSKITLFVPIGTGYAYRHHPFYSKFKEVVIER